MLQEDGNAHLDAKSEKMVKAAKVIIVIVAVFCALAGITAATCYFVFDVKLNNKALCDKVYTMAMKRMQEIDKVPPQQNGYSVLAHITEKGAPSQAIVPYTALSKYCSGKTPEIEAGLLRDKKQTEKDIKNFEAKLPEIKKSISQKYYFYPAKGDFGIDTEFPNYLVIRSTMQSLVALGVYREMQNRPEEAARCYLLAIRYGVMIGSHGFLLTQMISVAIENIGCNPLHCLLANGNMKSSAYRKIIAELEALPMEDEDFLRAMDEEYARTINTFDDLQNGKLGKSMIMPFNIPPQKVKFVIEREKRFYMNLYIKYRPCFENLAMPEEMGLSMVDDMQALSKKMSVICAIVFPNFSRATVQKRLILTKISALKIVAAIQAYRADRGRYPSALSDLSPDYLKTIPPDYMSRNRAFCYKARGKKFCLKSKSEFYSNLSMKNPFYLYPPDSSIF